VAADGTIHPKTPAGMVVDKCYRAFKNKKVLISNCNKDSAEFQWTFEESGLIKNGADDTRCWAAQVNKNGAKLALESCNADNANQQFAYNMGKITHASGNGRYCIHNIGQKLKMKVCRGNAHGEVSIVEEEPEVTMANFGDVALKAYVSSAAYTGWVQVDQHGVHMTEAFDSYSFASGVYARASMANDFVEGRCDNAVALAVDADASFEDLALQTIKLTKDGVNTCATLMPENADWKSFRSLHANGVMTLFHDSANNILVGNNQHKLEFFSAAGCSADASGSFAASTGAWDSNTWQIVHGIESVASVQAFSASDEAGDCVDAAFFAAQHVVSDAMVFEYDGVPGLVNIKLRQPTPFCGTMVNVVYENVAGLGKYHVHEYQMNEGDACTATGGHYNPFNVDLTKPADGGPYGTAGQLSYETGDLSGKHGLFSGDDYKQSGFGVNVYWDVDLPIWGQHSVAARGIVLHDASGSRKTCGNFGHQCTSFIVQPPVNRITVTYSGIVEGTQVLEQSAVCPSCPTMVKTDLKYGADLDTYYCADGSPYAELIEAPCATTQAEHKYHIHTLAAGAGDFAHCGATGGHYNPQEGVPCHSGTQGSDGSLCEIGDLSNKLGKLVFGDGNGTKKQQTDLYAPLSGLYSFNDQTDNGNGLVHKSITIHAPTGDRMSCADVELALED